MSKSIESNVSITLAQIICNAIYPYSLTDSLGSRLLSAQASNPGAYAKLVDNRKKLIATGSFESANKVALEILAA